MNSPKDQGRSEHDFLGTGEAEGEELDIHLSGCNWSEESDMAELDMRRSG